MLLPEREADRAAEREPGSPNSMCSACQSASSARSESPGDRLSPAQRELLALREAGLVHGLGVVGEEAEAEPLSSGSTMPPELSSSRMNFHEVNTAGTRLRISSGLPGRCAI